MLSARLRLSDNLAVHLSLVYLCSHCHCCSLINAEDFLFSLCLMDVSARESNKLGKKAASTSFKTCKEVQFTTLTWMTDLLEKHTHHLQLIINVSLTLITSDSRQ